MSDSTESIVRQAVALPGGSCDMRLGRGALGRLGRELRILVGRPRVAAILAADDVVDGLLDVISRDVTDADFLVHVLRLPHGPACRTPEAVAACWGQLASLGVTSDDVLVAVGDVDVLSAATFVATTWCSGTSLAMVALDADAVVEAVTCPRGLSVAGTDQMVGLSSHTQMLICDPDVMDLAPSPSTSLALAISVASAVGDGEAAFSNMGLRADELAAGDVHATCDQLLDATKQRGRMVSATSVAVRQGVTYGLTFSRALAAALPADLVADVGHARLLAEGLRFSSRLAVGAASGDVDLVFAQDALLDHLGLSEVPCELSPDELLAAIKAEGLLRSNRYLFALPLALGRIRLTAVPDEVMDEHLGAWCKTRARLARKGA